MFRVPVFLQAEALGATLALLLVAFIIAAIVAFVLVAVWLYNDCRQRGENAALWLTLYIALGLVLTFIVSAIVVLIYLVTRSKDIKYDRQGNLLVPAAPPTPMYYGQQPASGWQPAAPPPAGAPPPSAPPTPPSPYYSYGGTPSTSTPAPRPGWVPPTLSKVRCPRCRTVFEYQKQPAGQTHVKCPACGEEGNI